MDKWAKNLNIDNQITPFDNQNIDNQNNICR